MTNLVLYSLKKIFCLPLNKLSAIPENPFSEVKIKTVDPHPGHISFVEIGHEIISTVILSLLLIQVCSCQL